jgi:D-alanyl-D-alanine carboxypeptidase
VDPRTTWSGIAAALISALGMAPLLLAASHAPHQAESVSPPQPPETLDVAALDAYLAAQVKSGGFLGLSVAVVKGGDIVLAKGYGWANRETRTPVDADTAFAIGSVTKQFTCAGTLLLQEEGKLSLDDKVSKYYPDLTRASDITLDDLGAHVSGYPDYYPLDFLDERSRHPILPDDLIHRYAGDKLDFEPRSRWSYSNTGFIVLGRVVERVSGQGLGDFFASRFFAPLGMTHASYEPTRSAPGIAQGYEAFALGEPAPAEREATGWMGGAGAVYASAQDLAKWDVALMDGKVMKPESWERMTTTRVLGDGHKTGYGCGIGLTQMNNESILQHSGEVNGFLAVNVIIPRMRSAVAVLSNDQGKDPRSLARLLARLLLKQGETPPPRVDGLPALDVARGLMTQMRTGKLDRSKLGADFDAYVREDMATGAASRLAALGEPTSSELESTSERGGMEVSVVHFSFKTAKIRALMFRSVDGKVQEFLLGKE